MKHLQITLSLAVLFGVFHNSFSQIDLELQTQAGYEYNYFKSPDKVLFQGVLLDENDLIASSTYQRVNLDFEYKKEWVSSKLRLIATPNLTLYYENLDDSFWDVTVMGKYYHYLTRRTTLLTEINFKRMNRRGLDGAQDVLVNPLGFTNFGAKTGLEFEPFKRNKTKVQAFYNFRNFDAYGERDLEFSEMGLSLTTRQNLKVGGSRHKVGLYAYYKMRKYDTFNATNIIADGVRDWSYIKINPYYQFPLGSDLRLKPSFLLYQRIDKIDRSGFTQFGPELELKYSHSKMEFELETSYLTRNYKSIEARNNNGVIGENLNYKYIEFNLKVDYNIQKNLSITATGHSRLRHTNYTDLAARSFRGYRNQYVGLGVKWRL